jgi:diguanylate cyclase (GGDEF)-like protein
MRERGAIVGAVVAFQDISERRQTELRIRQLAYYDNLTSLPNRRLLQDRLGQAMAQARRYQRSLAVMFLDLDRFKQINDMLGHDAGDELLRQVANRLDDFVRAEDTVSRPGGDEFVIVLAEISQPRDAALVAEKILAALRQPVHLLGRDVEVTTSIGIVVHGATGTDSIQELMRKADLAMYQAKEAGRNGYRFYEAA